MAFCFSLKSHGGDYTMDKEGCNKIWKHGAKNSKHEGYVYTGKGSGNSLGKPTLLINWFVFFSLTAPIRGK